MRYFTFSNLVTLAVICFGFSIIRTPVLKETHEDFFFEVTATSSKVGHFQVFLDDGYGFREKHVITREITEIGKPILYRFPLPEGRYKALRFDPNQKQGFVLLKDPRIIDSKKTVIRDIGLAECEAEKQIESLKLTDHGLEITTAKDAADPDIVVSFQDPLVLKIPVYRAFRREALLVWKTLLRTSFLFLPLSLLLLIAEKSVSSNASLQLRLNAQKETLSLYLSAFLFLLLAVKELSFVNTYAVNLLFWDQWDFYVPLFKHQSLWDVFSRQHGPHRQGVGLLLTDLLAHLSHWNSRVDAFAACVILITAGVLGYFLLKQFKPLHAFSFLGLPFLFLNFHQWEVFVGPTNLSHGVMPILLMLGYCMTWFIKNPYRKWSLLSVLSFCLIFTGFGLFMGLITPLLAGIELLQAYYNKDKNLFVSALIGIISTGFAWFLFFNHYLSIALEPTGPATLNELITFVGLMVGNFFGLTISGAFSEITGLLIFLFIFILSVYHVRQCILFSVRDNPKSTVIFSLGAYALIYCLITAHGRAGSYEAAAPIASRYVTLMISAGLALLLHFSSTVKRKRYIFCYVIFLSFGTTYLQPIERGAITYYSEGKKAWKEAYLKTHDQIKAEQASDFPIYPGRIPERLEYLKKEKLNLFDTR